MQAGRLVGGLVECLLHHVEDVGWINGVIEFDGKDWKLMDPTFAATSSSPESFTADDDSYITKYVY